MLKAKYKGGSSVLLPQPNDTDYFFYYDTPQECREALIKNHDHSVDNHYRVIGYDPRVSLWCYVFPFMELVEGEEIKELKEFSIFDEQVKTEYIALLKKEIERINKSSKRWYHIVIAYYMYQNGEMTLTSQQLKVAQDTHDKGVSDYMFNKIVDYFEK